jgi:hypothetical protein
VPSASINETVGSLLVKNAREIYPANTAYDEMSYHSNAFPMDAAAIIRAVPAGFPVLPVPAERGGVVEEVMR